MKKLNGSMGGTPRTFSIRLSYFGECCDAELKRGDGIWESLKATWEGRLILDGYVIADEYRMTTPAGELLVLGINLRSYDVKKKTWNMKWLDALGGTSPVANGAGRGIAKVGRKMAQFRRCWCGSYIDAEHFR
jgi:hypothetical protein